MDADTDKNMTLREQAEAFLNELFGDEKLWSQRDLGKLETAFKAQRAEECEAIAKEYRKLGWTRMTSCEDVAAWLDARAKEWWG